MTSPEAGDSDAGGEVDVDEGGPAAATSAARKTLLEVGCGVGNAVIPLMEAYPTL